MFRKIFLFSAFLSLLFLYGCCGICHSKLMYSSYMEPGAPVVDLNKEIQQRCVETFSGSFGKECHLSIIAPIEIKFSSEKIVKAYEKVLSTVEALSQKSFPKKHFQLILINFNKTPKNYTYNVQNIKSQESMLVILE